MKKGLDFVVNKYVYRLDKDDIMYYRIDYFGTKKFLKCEFPVVAKIANLSSSFKVRMYVNHREITAWIDKHKNIVVRVIDYSIKQTKINF